MAPMSVQMSCSNYSRTLRLRSRASKRPSGRFVTRLAGPAPQDSRAGTDKATQTPASVRHAAVWISAGAVGGAGCQALQRRSEPAPDSPSFATRLADTAGLPGRDPLETTHSVAADRLCRAGSPPQRARIIQFETWCLSWDALERNCECPGSDAACCTKHSRANRPLSNRHVR